MDVLGVSESELTYQAISSDKLYECKFIQNSEACNNSTLLFNCKGCSYCFGCVGLRNKQYHIFNKPYSKENYTKKLEELGIGSYKNLEQAKKEFEKTKLQFPHKFARMSNSQDSTEDNLFYVNNSKFCFDVKKETEDSKFIVNGVGPIKDLYDGYGVGATAELLYEVTDSGDQGTKNLFAVFTWGSTNTTYTYGCHGSKNCFGCVSIRSKEYCILNKQYSKEEYEELVPKIITHMNKMPYKGNNKKEYKYGEFFPIEISPFAYNETVAQEYEPLTKNEAEKKGYTWKEEEKKNYGITKHTKDLPDNINEIKEDILGEVIECEHKGECKEKCTTAFKITKEELQLYKKLGIPLPRLCSNCRHFARVRLVGLPKLHHRKCHCAGESSENNVYKNTTNHSHHDKEHCPNEFETTYAPDRPETIYCEACYQQEVN
ncbi:hypothetical protein CL629_04875 [bacterium]|nr:hypothetical protein [bacterium]